MFAELQIYLDGLNRLEGENQELIGKEPTNTNTNSNIGLHPSPSVATTPYRNKFTSLISFFEIADHIKRQAKLNTVSIELHCSTNSKFCY